jgi:acetylornithine deacetylase/succinyl-diaminopimelate desuccinylase-like protein
MERMAELGVDECSVDRNGNAVGIIRGCRPELTPIFVVAHVDTFLETTVDHFYSVDTRVIKGAGVSDNTAAVGVLVSLPEIFKRLKLQFDSDLVLVGAVECLGKGNLKGIRKLLKAWPGAIRAGLCLESVTLGRLNYYSNGMIRGEIHCSTSQETDRTNLCHTNAILVLNEIINQMLEIGLPQKPRTRIIIGKIAGGFNHGQTACEAGLGFEIQSDDDAMVRAVYSQVVDIVQGVRHEHQVELYLQRISNLNATSLRYNHPLVKAATRIMEKLQIRPLYTPSESAFSIFIGRKIPAITLGLSRGDNMHQADATVEIEPIFTGIAHIIGTLAAMDQGVCDE